MKLCFVAKKPSYKDYPNEPNTLGDHLRKARLDRNLSQIEVADMLGVAEMSINAWELNRNKPTAKYAKKVIEFIGFIPKDWFNGPFHKRLYQARLIGGKTIREVSQITNLDFTTISLIERGKRSPMPTSINRLSAFIQSQQMLPSEEVGSKENAQE